MLLFQMGKNWFITSNHMLVHDLSKNKKDSFKDIFIVKQKNSFTLIKIHLSYIQKQVVIVFRISNAVCYSMFNVSLKVNTYHV